MLRKPDPPSRAALKTNKWRDDAICQAVEYGMEAGLKATRGRDQRHTNGAHSACSLVAEELEKVGLHLSEDAVEKIWRGKPARYRIS